MNKAQKKWAKSMPKQIKEIYWHLPWSYPPHTGTYIFDPLQACIIFGIFLIVGIFVFSYPVFWGITKVSMLNGVEEAVVDKVAGIFRHELLIEEWWYIPRNIINMASGDIFNLNYLGILLGYLPIYLTLGISISLAIFLSWLITKPSVYGERHKKGMKLVDGVRAVKSLEKTIIKEGKGSPEALFIHPCLPDLSHRRATRGLLYVGGTGTGKTTVLLPQIIRALRSRRRTLIYDYKGDFTEKLLIPILAPWDARSLRWDIGRDITNKAEAEMFSTSIVLETTDTMWSNASRQFLIAAILACIYKKKTNWTLRDLCNILSDEAELQKSILTFLPEATVTANAIESITGIGILINLSASLSVIFSLAELFESLPQDAGKWSISGWLSRKCYQQIILQGHPTRVALSQSMTGIVFKLILEKMAKLPDVSENNATKRGTYLFIDELPTLGKITAIQQMVTVLRSKGLISVFAIQDPAQLVDIYGIEVLKVLWSSIATKIILGMSSGDSASLIAGQLGERIIDKLSETQNTNGSISRNWISSVEPVLTSNDLNSLIVREDTGVPALITASGWSDLYYLSWPLLMFETKREKTVENKVEIASYEKQITSPSINNDKLKSYYENAQDNKEDNLTVTDDVSSHKSGITTSNNPVSKGNKRRKLSGNFKK